MHIITEKRLALANKVRTHTKDLVPGGYNLNYCVRTQARTLHRRAVPFVATALLLFVFFVLLSNRRCCPGRLRHLSSVEPTDIICHS